MRRRLVAGNWKMNLLRGEAVDLVRRIGDELAVTPASRTRVVLFPSFVLLDTVKTAFGGISGNGGLALGGQDLHPEDKGAHTGDVSGAQLADAGCRWALAGHSERRQNHGESDELVGRKVAAALRNGLSPIACVGETREERQSGRAFAVLERQTRAALAALAALVEQPDVDAALAYEPVWAIGTGETATPAIAQETHRFLRGLLAELLGAERAEALPILYGGSVTPANAPDLIAESDIDGFLVGGSALDPEKFLSIIRASG